MKLVKIVLTEEAKKNLPAEVIVTLEKTLDVLSWKLNKEVAAQVKPK